MLLLFALAFIYSYVSLYFFFFFSFLLVLRLLLLVYHRAERDASGVEGIWARGNINRMGSDDSPSGKGDGEAAEKADEDEDEDGAVKDPYAISDNSEDEEQMAEIRRKILNSKAFQTSTGSEKPALEKIT